MKTKCNLLTKDESIYCNPSLSVHINAFIVVYRTHKALNTTKILLQLKTNKMYSTLHANISCTYTANIEYQTNRKRKNKTI